MHVRVGDVHLFFDVDGEKLAADGAAMREKPTLLLLHGGPGFDHSILKPWFEPLRDVAQLVYLDHRANGRSERGSSERLGLDQWGDDVRAFCDALGIEQPIVFGVSFGGFVAQAYATRHPDHPKGLILCNTSPRYRPDRVLPVFERLGGREARDAAEAFLQSPSLETLSEFGRLCTPVYNRQPQDPNQIARSLPHINMEMMLDFFGGEFHRFDFLDALSKVRCPTLVLSGGDDPITPAADGEDIARAVASHLVRLERFAGCGHPVYQDDSDRFLRVTREFLASL